MGDQDAAIQAASAATAQAIVENANRLGLTWELRPATITSSDPLTLIVDGDSESLPATLMLATSPNKDDRVYVILVPPGGVFVVGVANPTEYRARVTFNTTTASYIFANIPNDLTQLTLGYSACGDGAGLIVELLLRLNGDAGAKYISERALANGATASAILKDNLNTSTFIGYIGGVGSGVFGSGEVTWQGWDLANLQRPQWTWIGGVQTSGGIAMTGAGNFNQIGSLNRIDIFPSPGNFIPGSTLYLHGFRI